MKRININVDEYTDEKLEELKARTTMSKSLIVRLAVKKFYKSYK